MKAKVKKPIDPDSPDYDFGGVGGRGCHPADPDGSLFGKTHWPLPQKHEMGASMKYMLIDVTTTEETSLIAVATLDRVQLLGKIAQAKGRKVIAPPVEGRGFSKLERVALQYFYWNVCKETPSDVYEFLVSACLKKIEQLPVDVTPLDELKTELRRIAPEPEVSQQASGTPTDSKPRNAGATGKVWVIADEVTKTLGRIDRKAIIEACESAGINGATAATQFAKWKKQKSI